MYCTISDFVKTWRDESESTIKIFSNISDEKLNEKISENVRTLGRNCWHITQTLTEMPSQVNIGIENVLDKKPIPSTTKEIIDTYKYHSEEMIKAIQEKWKDEDLSEVVDIYGERWERGRILAMLVNHQIHHRGQITVVMRLLGLQVPGIYGPSKEEWVNYGVEPQE